MNGKYNEQIKIEINTNICIHINCMKFLHPNVNRSLIFSYGNILGSECLTLYTDT